MRQPFMPLVLLAASALPANAAADTTAEPKNAPPDVVAPAEPATQTPQAASADATWPTMTIQPGLQMWTPVYAGADGSLRPQSTVGGVLKVNYALNEPFGLHVRGAYGGNTTKDHTPAVTTNFAAWAVGLGVDFSATLGDRVSWTNTMGVGYGRNNSQIDDGDQPEVTALGAYFVTGLDVTIMGSMGVWMDWGCQVVGPSTAMIPATAGEAAFEASTWHINALGAGGMRLAF